MPKTPRTAGKAAASSAPKRAYLSRELRRQSLLEIAAGIVESEGWAALNMSVLAERSGTSRQLIYQHFPNMEQLLADTAWQIFTDTMKNTSASIAANPESLAQAVKAAEAYSLDLPTGRGDALWQLLAGTASNTPELEKIRRGIRDLVRRLWTPVLRKHMGLSEADAKVYAWMSILAFWGMRQLVRDGEISRARGVRLFNEFIERVGRP